MVDVRKPMFGRESELVGNPYLTGLWKSCPSLAPTPDSPDCP